MADEAGNREAFLIQEHYCRAMGALAHQVMRVMSWPGHAEPVTLGTAHARAARVQYGTPIERDAIMLPEAVRAWP